MSLSLPRPCLLRGGGQGATCARPRWVRAPRAAALCEAKLRFLRLCLVAALRRPTGTAEALGLAILDLADAVAMASRFGTDVDLPIEAAAAEGAAALLEAYGDAEEAADALRAELRELGALVFPGGERHAEADEALAAGSLAPMAARRLELCRILRELTVRDEAEAPTPGEEPLPPGESDDLVRARLAHALLKSARRRPDDVELLRQTVRECGGARVDSEELDWARLRLLELLLLRALRAPEDVAIGPLREAVGLSVEDPRARTRVACALRGPRGLLVRRSRPLLCRARPAQCSPCCCRIQGEVMFLLSCGM